VVRRLLLTAAMLAGSATAAVAHHSIAGVYDSKSSVTVDGVVSEFHFVNPHPFVIVSADRNGQPETWKLELDNRFELVDAGMKTDTLKAGDRIVARGSRARDGSRSLYALRIDRPADGFYMEQVGSSPKIGRAR